MNPEQTKLLILSAVFLSFASIGYLLCPKDMSTFKKRLEEQRKSKSGLLLLISPLLKMIGGFFESMDLPFIKTYLKIIKKILISGAFDSILTPAEFLGIQIITPLCCYPVLILGAVRIESLKSLQNPGTGIFVAIIVFIVGAVIPFIILNDKVQRRKKSISRELPFSLDMLTSAVEAGLDFSGAIRRLVQKASKKTPLKDELGIMLKEINLGKTRAQALAHMGERVNLTELTTVCNSLIQADQLGTGVGAVLTTLSDDIRTKRFQKAEKMALEAPVKMLFPLIAFIFPAVFIILIGPLILQIVAKVGSQ